MMASSETEAVYSLMVRAASQDPAHIQEAYKQLSQWETQPKFFSAVQQVFSNKAIDVNVRQVAVIFFKNGVDRYWRKRAPKYVTGGISEEEKAVLRALLLTATLDEEVPQLFRQLQVLVAKAARQDWPNDWPALMGDLIHGFSTSEDPQRRLRALFALDAVVKEVASKVVAKRNFRQIAPELCAGVHQLWSGYVSGTHPHGPEGHVCIKILRRLLCYGFADLTTVPHLDQFMAGLLEFLRASVAEWARYPVDSAQQIPIEKSIKHMCKLLLEVQAHHPGTFVPYLAHTLSLFLDAVLTNTGPNSAPSVFVIRCLRLINDVMNEYEYNVDARGLEAEPAQAVVRSIVTDSVLVDLTRVLLTRYFIMTPNDLTNWQESPEQYAHDSVDLSLFEIKPCAETLYKTLMSQHRALISPVVMELLHSTTDGPCDPNNLHAVLVRDAVYNASGLAAHDLYDVINFQAWLARGLVQEIAVVHPNYKIIRRRIAHLVEQWAGVCKFPAEMHGMVYQILLALHQKSEDLVVRLSANSALRAVIDCVDFRTYAFREYVAGALESIFQLLFDLEEDETKMSTVNTLALLLDRCRAEMKPYGMVIAKHLGELWQDSQDRNMLQCNIVSTLKSFVEAMGTDGQPWHDELLAIVAYCTDLAHPAHVYLLEDGLGLWTALLIASTQPSEPLVALFPRAVSLLEGSSEHVRDIIRIIDLYIAMHPQVVDRWGDKLCSVFVGRLDQWKVEGLELLARTADSCLVARDAVAVRVLTPLLTAMMKAIAERKEEDRALICYSALFARVCVQTTDLFPELMRNCSACGAGIPQLVGFWMDKLDEATDERHKKLFGLALAVLLGRGEGTVIESLPLVANACVQIMTSLVYEPSSEDYLLMGDDADMWQPEPGETPDVTRERELKRNDAVYRLSLRDALKRNFSVLQSDEAAFTSLMRTVDPVVARQLAHILS